MFFNGGEQVMTAAETAALQTARSPEAMQAVAFAPQVLAVMESYRARTVEPATAPSVEAVSSSYHAAPVSVQVNIQVDGSATEETVATLQEYGDTLTDTVTQRVLDALEEKRIDAARRAF